MTRGPTSRTKSGTKMELKKNNGVYQLHSWVREGAFGDEAMPRTAPLISPPELPDVFRAWGGFAIQFAYIHALMKLIRGPRRSHAHGNVENAIGGSSWEAVSVGFVEE